MHTRVIDDSKEVAQMLNSTTSRKVTPMSYEPSVRILVPVNPPVCSTHQGAWLATGTGSTSAFGTAVALSAFGPIVTADARVRDAKQAAPPRGQRC